MKTFLRSVWSFLLLWSASALWAGTMEITFDFSPEDVTVSPPNENGEVGVDLQDGVLGEGNPGKPWIPYKTVNVRLPEGEGIVDWSVEAGDEISLADGVIVLPEQEPYIPSLGKATVTPRDEAAYASTDVYPAKDGELLQVGHMRGVAIATFRLNPIGYVPAEKKLSLASSLTLKITTAPLPRTTGIGELPIPRSQTFEDAINSMVVNPDTRALPQTTAVNRSGSGCQYLIICPPAYATSAQKLADFRKEFNHVTAEVVTTDAISGSSGTAPTYTQVRNFIKNYVTTKGTEYVFLMGDENDIPPNYMSLSHSGYTASAPSDVGFYDLDSTIDFKPDVYVGRLPFSSAGYSGEGSWVPKYVQKVINYERGTTDDSDIVRKMLWAGFTLQNELKRTGENSWQDYTVSKTSGDNGTATAGTSGIQITETFDDGLVEINANTTLRPIGDWVNDKEMWDRRMNVKYHRKYYPNMRSSFFLGSATSWDTNKAGDYVQNVDNFSVALNRGFHQMYMDTHGSPIGLAIEGNKTTMVDRNSTGASYEYYYAMSLTNRVDFMFVEACDGSHYDQDYTCSAEGFLGASGGSLGVIGSTRYGWASPMTGSWATHGSVAGTTRGFAMSFFNRVLVQHDTTLGKAYAMHKADYGGASGSPYWMQHSIVLFGDPMLTYHVPATETRSSMKPGLVTLLRDTPIATTANSATIRVAADEIPLGQTATVALEYSTSSGFTSPTTVSVSTSLKKQAEFSKAITGLAAETTYYVRAKITLGGETHYSPFSLSFKTKAANGVEGTVRDGANLPVVGATVQAKSGGTVTASAVTDSYGNYYIPLAAGWNGTLSLSGVSGAVNPADPALTIAAGQTKTVNFSVEQVYFVKQGATGSGDGSSWANAFPSLATAFATVPPGSTIWVAEGTYYPEGSNGRDNHFAPPDHVSVYGGFAGTESGRDQRDWIAHPTILSADIGTRGTATDNCYHLIRYNHGVRLDGLNLQDAYMNNSASGVMYGKGSVIGSPECNPAPANSGTGGTYSRITQSVPEDLMIVEHCRIANNYGNPGISYGAQLSYQFVAYRNCFFEGNTHESTSSDALLENCYLDHCTLTGNKARRNIVSSSVIRNSIVYGNTLQNSDSGTSYASVMVYMYQADADVTGSGSFLTESWKQYTTYKPSNVYTGSAPGWIADASGFQYALAPNSYAADKGMTLDWVDEYTVDYLGNPRKYGDATDLGCCEAIAVGALKLGIQAGGAATLNTLSVQARVADFGTNATTQALSIEYSTSSTFSSSSTKSAGTASNGNTDWLSAVTISSLTPNTTYYLRAFATLGGEKVTSSTLALTTLDYGTPTLTVSAGTATRSAIPLTWSLSALGDGNDSATVYLDFGTSSSFGNTVTVKTGATAGASGSYTIEGLSAQKTYYVRVRAVTDKNKTGTSSTITPKTADMGNPAGGSVTVGTLGQRQAEVSWTVGTLGEGAASADVYIEWSTDTSYSNSQKVKTGVAAGASGSYTITGLNPSTKYNVRVRIVNDGGKSVTQTGSFTTKQEMNPAATGSLGTPGYTSVPVTLNLTSFGGTLTSATVLLEAFTSSTYSGTPAATLLQENVTSLGNLALNFGGLAMDTTYYIRATITNEEGGVIVLNLGSIKTGKIEDLPIGQGYWQSGFVMGYKLSAQGGSYTETDVSGATYSSMTSTELVRRPESAFMRAQEGTSVTINGHSYTVLEKSNNGKKDKNSLFCYEGEMWMEKNVTYYFASNMANIQKVSIDGTVVLTETNGGQLEPVTASYTPTTTGWHAFKVAHAAGGGYFGACDRCSPPSGSSMLVTSGPFWDDKIGIAWSTNITMSASYNRSMNDAQWAAQWTPLGDAGDRHLFRVRGTKPSLVSINASGAKFTTNGFTIPVQTDAVNSGCTLTLYYGNSGDAWYFENRWAGKKSVSVATGSVLTDMAVTGVTVGDGIWVSARLKSSDGSYDCWTDPVYCEKTGTVTPPTLDPPQFVADGTALAFGGAAGSETFSMTIANPVKGAYYTVFTSETLKGTFTAEKASVLFGSDASTFTLTVDGSVPTKFAKIVISAEPFAAGAAIPAAE